MNDLLPLAQVTERHPGFGATQRKKEGLTYVTEYFWREFV